MGNKARPGVYIKQLRKAKGLSQRKLAELSGVSSVAISRIETGSLRKVSPETLKDLKDVLCKF